jgi:hypothetical protein
MKNKTDYKQLPNTSFEISKHHEKSVPRLEFWRNHKHEFGYRTIGVNGKAIGGEENQGFKRLKGMIDNIIANAKVWGLNITFQDMGKHPVRGIFTTDGGKEIPLTYKATKK